MCFPNGGVEIVDFGTNFFHPLNARRAIREATNVIGGYNFVDAVITHLHYDHYSLIPHILGTKTLRMVYLPLIPKPKRIRDMVCKLMALQSVILLRSGKATLDEIAKKAQAACLICRGNSITPAKGFNVKVLWPPPTLPSPIAERVQEKLEAVYQKAEKLMEMTNVKDEVERKAEKIKNIVEDCARKLEENERKPIEIGSLPIFPTLTAESLRQRQSPEAMMMQLEREVLAHFRDAINDLSLVLKYYHYDNAVALIPGDNSRQVLDYLSRLEKCRFIRHRQLVFLRGAHHGTYYGRYLGKHKAIVTWMSWTRNMNAQPHLGYLHTSKLIVLAEDTEHLHIAKCSLYPYWQHYRIHTCTWSLGRSTMYVEC